MFARLAIIVLWGVAAPLVSGQGVDRPIDQGVEDVDPQAVSFRVMDPGNAMYPTRSMIVERAHQASWSQLGMPVLDHATGKPDTHRYEYRAPGIRARMDRPDYLVLDRGGQPAMNTQPIVDGAFVERAPPNMVYVLSPDLPDVTDPAILDPSWNDPRVDGRINNRSDQQYGHYHPGNVATSQAQPQHTVQRFEIRRLHGKRYADEAADTPQTEPPTPQPGTNVMADADESPQQAGDAPDDAHQPEPAPSED